MIQSPKAFCPSKKDEWKTVQHKHRKRYCVLLLLASWKRIKGFLTLIQIVHPVCKAISKLECNYVANGQISTTLLYLLNPIQKQAILVSTGDPQSWNCLNITLPANGIYIMRTSYLHFQTLTSSALPPILRELPQNSIYLPFANIFRTILNFFSNIL